MHPSRDELVARRRAVLGGSNLRLFFDPEPLQVVRGEGVFLYDAAGKRYVDCYNNVASLGHVHPVVTEALIKQAKLVCTNTRYLTEESVVYAERLLGTFRPGSGLDTVILVNSGSEANDVAWRIVKACTGKSGGLTVENGYHGITDAITAFTPSVNRKAPLAPHIRTFPPPDRYRGASKGLATASDFAKLLDKPIAELTQSQFGFAGTMIDSMFMSNGVLEAPAGYLKLVCDKVHEAGGLYIADEVQSGFGRTGEAFWGFEYHGVTPDLVTIGKPAGNGHPLGAIVTSRRLVDKFNECYGYFSTFGGNNVSCAVGTAVIDVIEKQNLVANAKRLGAMFKTGLERLKERYSIIGEVRGTGLALGVEFVSDRNTKEPAKEVLGKFLQLLKNEGVLCGNDGTYNNCVKIRPPLISTTHNIDFALNAFDRALKKLTEQKAKL